MQSGRYLSLFFGLLLCASPASAMDRPQSPAASGVDGAQVSTTDSAVSPGLEDNPVKTEDSLRYLADIRVHSAEELETLLRRVDQLMQTAVLDDGNPVVFLLHGEEARTLFKASYQQHKGVVDLAARLSAFGVVDIKVCETWAGRKGLDKNNLQPFVATVPYAPAEEKRLTREQGYLYF